MTIIKPKGEFLILAGDESGMITAGKVVDQNMVIASFGAHNDGKHGASNGVVDILLMPDNINLYTLGVDGTLRHWVLE